MKKILFSALLIAFTYLSFAQGKESDQTTDQGPTATTKSSTRLFKLREDLTSVITIIPAGSQVTYLDSDSTYMHVIFDSNEGYIFRKHAILDKSPAVAQKVQPRQEVQPQPEVQPEQEQPADRYTYLVNKYGSTMAGRIYAGKIWKGMNSDMVRDSWGAADKVNRVVNDNLIKEEWIYRTTWLYFENNTLLQWGPTSNR
jgi:hypothetical protein